MEISLRNPSEGVRGGGGGGAIPYLSHGLFWEIFNVFKCGECYLGVSNIHTDKKFALFFPYKPM